MRRKNQADGPLSADQFMNELYRYRKGSVTRRHFLGVTGLGWRQQFWARRFRRCGRERRLQPLPARYRCARGPITSIRTIFDNFTKDTGVPIQVTIFGSNEEMLAKLQAGGTGWDVFVPTNYTISTYVKLGLIDPLDVAKLANFDASAHDPRFTDAGTVDGKVYAVPKDWGTTGYAINTKTVSPELSTWKEFWDKTQTDYSGKVTVHDYQLTTIGNALKYFGYSFNSVDPERACGGREAASLAAKPHLFAITSDYQPAMRNGDACHGDVLDRRCHPAVAATCRK